MMAVNLEKHNYLNLRPSKITTFLGTELNLISHLVWMPATSTEKFLNPGLGWQDSKDQKNKQKNKTRGRRAVFKGVNLSSSTMYNMHYSYTLWIWYKYSVHNITNSIWALRKWYKFLFLINCRCSTQTFQD